MTKYSDLSTQEGRKNQMATVNVNEVEEDIRG